MRRLIVLFLLIAPLTLNSGCRTPPAQAKAPVAEPYLSDPNSVGFDIAPMPYAGGSRRWLATYSDQGKTAKFIIELSSSKPMDSEPGIDLEMSSGEGAIVAVSGSDASVMLVALAKALEAKHVPVRVKRASRLPFEYVILGEHNSQAQGGGLSAKPAGNWAAMKIFLGKEDEAEVFLNFNPVTRKAQFSEKDVDYGDPVVARLATVL